MVNAQKEVVNLNVGNCANGSEGIGVGSVRILLPISSHRMFVVVKVLAVILGAFVCVNVFVVMALKLALTLASAVGSALAPALASALALASACLATCFKNL